MSQATRGDLLQRLRRLLSVRRREATNAEPADPRFAPIDLPGGHARFRSVALPLIGVLVLVASWTVGVSYYFHQRSAEQLFLDEQREKAERAASMVRTTVISDLRVLEESTHLLAERGDLAAALQNLENEDAVRSWLQRWRRPDGAAAVEIFGSSGQLIERIGNPEQVPPGAAAKARLVTQALNGHDGISIDESNNGLTLRASSPVVARNRVVGAVVAEQRIDDEYLGLLGSRLGFGVNLVAPGRALVVTSEVSDAHWLQKLQPALNGGVAATVALEGTKDVALLPLPVAGEPIAVAVMMPN